MKEKINKYLNILLIGYKKREESFQVDLLNVGLKDNERLEINGKLKEMSSKVIEVKECIEYISKLPDFHVIDFSEPVKSYRISPVSGLLDDFVAGNLNEDEFNEVITNFDNIKKEYKPITFFTSYQQELIKDSEAFLNEYKQADSEEKKYLIVEKKRNIFFDKFYDSFPDFCFMFGRTLDSYYAVEVAEKYIEFLKALDYKTAEKEMLIWCTENLRKLK